ncbi:MICAL-like protein 1 isoform X2 [Ruditapes philippinarum]|uniref:MICAL-like protein 1 isoform X2 n=1 Tax=Ruditapes philippinarum TaxID=129788 RepID=UPI00295AC298|nr:MICAL-like protein 1 isoform X2 [Ruditapes philippinarum]
MAMTKVKNLQLWCKKMADGYRDVEVRDMAASWKSGLAFCAIIHRFRPDLIDYDSLSKENVFENNDLAFEVAEKQLSIPAFLEAADMVAIRVPDRLSVVTYVSQYYNYFHDKPQLGGPGVNKFNKSAKTKDNVTQPVNKSLTPAKTNQQKIEKQESIGDKCTICHERVYLLERHIENSKLYHRSCFRKSELSPTSKVFKRQPNTLFGEDKNDLISTKHRKIDSDTVKKECKDDGLDFWQRRAQQKAKENERKKGADTPVVKLESKSEAKVNTQTVNNDDPIWKRGLEKKDQMFASGDEKSKDEPKIKTGLADRFKELDQRNLKGLNSTETKKNVEIVKERDKKDIGDTKKKFEKTVDNKNTENKVVTPVAKPRQNVLSRYEQMETDTNESQVPKPVPRFQKKDETVSPKAAPRKIEHKIKSPTTPRKNELTRPKTPPNVHKSEFSLNLTKVKGNLSSTHKDNSPASPPPLPGSSPPRMPTSQPPKLPSSNKSSDSPVTSPRLVNKHNKMTTDKDIDKKPVLRSNIPPSKPPRIMVEETTRSPSPARKDKSSKLTDNERSVSSMDTSEMHEAPKAHIKGPKTEFTAAVVIPNRPQNEEKNREVFGGLLKSLAGVRHKYDHDEDNKGKPNGAISDKENKSNVKINGAKHEEEVGLRHKVDKVKESEKKDFSKSKIPPRPKSSFVSQSSNLFDSDGKKESNVKVDITKKTTTKTTVVTYHKDDKSKSEETKTTVTKEEDDVPEWKRALEQRKKERARPKSVDILSEKSDIGNVPLWKIEADKRKEARKGGYIDPEKVKIDDKNTNRNNASRALSPVGMKNKDISDKYVAPSADYKIELPQRHKIEYKGENVNENQKPSEVSKKRITVDHKFKFDEIEVTPAPKKPPRPATQPHSPKVPTSPGPARPPPPKTEGFKGSKHITAYQIQKQLQVIDTKLTQLELKGRSLEDSIRNGHKERTNIRQSAKDEEEDDLMMAWFQLVNEKNELVRKECDYIYVSREQELEIEQQQIDQKLRELVDKKEKTKADEEEEELLMEKLVDVVNQRSKIVDSIDEDRIRYMEEDNEIEAMLQLKAFSKQYKKPKKKKKLGFLKDNKDGAIKKEKKKAKQF